jgi:hypothetical protein
VLFASTGRETEIERERRADLKVGGGVAVSIAGCLTTDRGDFQQERDPSTRPRTPRIQGLFDLRSHVFLIDDLRLDHISGHTEESGYIRAEIRFFKGYQQKPPSRCGPHEHSNYSRSFSYILPHSLLRGL